MNEKEMILQIETQIQNLECQKSRIENKIKVARDYLKVLKNEDEDQSSYQQTQKGNQTPQAREKMKMAQQARQEREKKLRFRSITDFLGEKISATTSEIASHLKLSENATKKYLRACEEVEEIGINIWKYKIPF
ncbi:hypothetical protein IKE67_00675 [bacterium]|nr:hypothetical protein [bacterium]